MALIRGVVYSNFFVALILTLLASSTYTIVAGMPIKWYVIVSVFLGSFALYNFHRLYKIDHIPEIQLGDRHRWMLRCGKWIKYSMAICIFAAMIILPNYTANDIVWLVPAAMVSVSYTIPVVPTDSKWWRLRDIPLAKPLIISLVVTYLTLCFPIFEQYDIHEIFTRSRMTLFIERFVFLLSVTIPFEMRDIKSDQDAGLSTLATYLGFDFAKKIALAVLVLWIGLFVTRLVLIENYLLAIVGVLIFILGLFGVVQIRKNRSELYFVIVFEGLIALYAIAILLFG